MSKPYTEEDVQLVGKALWEACRDEFPKLKGAPTETCFTDARFVLDALAEAGRLRPARFDLGNPLGWTPEQIRAAEERSNELDKLIDRGSDG